MSNQRGVSIIAVVATMLILSVMGAALISLVSTGSDISINQMQSEQSFNVAVGGMEYVLERYSFPNYSTPLTKTLGDGSFTVNTVYPVAILVNPIIVGDTTITVSTTTGFVIPGTIKVESEYLYCNGTDIAPVRFTGCGPAVSGHVAGSNLFQYIITSTGTVGNAQRVVRGGVDRGSGVITPDNKKVKTGNNSISMNWKHNISGTNRLLIVGVAIRNNSGQTVSSVSYSGAGLSPVPGSAISNGTNTRVEMWYITNPSLGNNDVVVNLTGSADMVAGSVSLNGVDQVAPIDVVFIPATSFGITPVVTATTTADGAWVIDTMGAGNVGAVVDASQVEQWNARAGTGGNRVRGAGSSEGPNTPPGSVTMSWTLDSSTNWAITAVSVRPAAGNVALLEFREVF